MKNVKTYGISEFLNSISYRGLSFSPDGGKVLLSNNTSGIYNAYTIPSDGGEASQLTFSVDNSIFVISYFPHDERFLFTSDQGGDELHHIYVRDLEGEEHDLTPGTNLKAMFSGWAPNGESFFIETNERNPLLFDVYEYDSVSYNRTLLYQNDAGGEFAGMSPDRQYIVLAKAETWGDSNLFLYHRNTAEIENITPHEGDVINRPASWTSYGPGDASSSVAFAPSGDSFLYLTDSGSEFQYLVQYNIVTRKHTKIFEDEWDIVHAYLSPKGGYLAVGTNIDARVELRLYESTTLDEIKVPGLPDAGINLVAISPSEEHLIFYASNGKIPQDLFSWRFHELKTSQLTQSLNKEIDPGHLVEGQVVRFSSYDGTIVPGILYQPHTATEMNKVPALVFVHGGPGGQSDRSYNALFQYLVNHEYAVFAINNRGSSGYGKTFYHMDDRKHGDADLDDVVESKHMLGGTGYIDPERIGIIGQSYGGYMTLAALTFRPNAFDVGVDIYGISNWQRTLQNIPPWWGSRRKGLETEMGDFDDEEFFRAKSPIFHSQNIIKPLMVLQGANDPRVLQVESDQIVDAVRSNEVPVEYVVFSDEGHGFMKKENQISSNEAILAFLERYLRNKPL